ncbi:MAG: GNAT family N-acetyltransferase [Oscillospiraceae bacterium]|nr:GNAT family N-acetyltransferase [Oscillospiraceae bacterium]
MSSDFKIRKIENKDKEAFLSMSREFYASSAVLHDIPEKYHESCFAELMRSEDYARAYILECAGKTAGYALLSLSYSREAGGLCTWIEELYVLPQFQGKGAAHIFFKWLEENIPAARYRLETEHDNSRAKKLYKSLGYSPLEYEQFIKGN